MSTQMRRVIVRIPFLTAYNRPLFTHHMEAILGEAFAGMGFAEGGQGETVRAEVPVQIMAKEVVGYATACLRSIGADGEAELIVEE